MFQRKPKRFRRHINGRNQALHSNRNDQNARRSNSFLNDHTRNNFRAFLSAEKLFEKYNTLAKEAVSSGDKTLVENYLQHADHFMRIIEDKNRSQSQSKTNLIHKTTADEKHLSQNNDINQDRSTDNKE